MVSWFNIKVSSCSTHDLNLCVNHRFLGRIRLILSTDISCNYSCVPFTFLPSSLGSLIIHYGDFGGLLPWTIISSRCCRNNKATTDSFAREWSCFCSCFGIRWSMRLAICCRSNSANKRSASLDANRTGIGSGRCCRVGTTSWTQKEEAQFRIEIQPNLYEGGVNGFCVW